ncbi:MAG: maleate cis-trans isomerase family protein [Nitrososphaerales archaeon]
MGLVIPASNAVAEEEFHAMHPDGVSIHTARMVASGFDANGISEMMKNASTAALELNDLHLKVLGIACASGGALNGCVGDEKLCSSVRFKVNIPTVSAAGAMIEALHNFDVKNIAVATPYTEFQREVTRHYLEEAGFEVMKISGLGMTVGISDLSPESSYEAAKKVDLPSADAVVISATVWRSIELIAKLEKELGKPVISSNTALMAAMLHRAGIHQSIPNYGRVLSEIGERHSASTGQFS